MAVKTIFEHEKYYNIGLSSDTKPAGQTPLSEFFEYDTFAPYVTYDGTNWVIDTRKGGIKKTIETELQAITAVAAGAQSISSVLDLSGQIKMVTIFIDHAKDDANASVGQGTEYVVQGSQKASGNDVWRAVAGGAFTATITAPAAIVTDASEAAGQTLIEIGATTPVVGDILFFKHSTIGSSEWANVIAISAGVSCTLESGLTTAQAQGTYYTQGEHFSIPLDVRTYTRLRVICNNTKGSTNRAIVYRVACISLIGG